MARLDLLSSTSRVEAPFIVAKIGGYTFGIYNKMTKNIVDATGSYNGFITDYPNFMQSLSVVKINGSVNTYTLVMKYAIKAGDDPNLLEKVFSIAKKDWKITLSYGDCMMPSFIYKEEECLINSIKSNFDIMSSTITYTIQCVSQALKLAAGTYNFPAKSAKPSDVIKQLLKNKTYGLMEIFYGMYDLDKVAVKGLIASDDKVVKIEAKQNITIFEYLKYLVSCMSCVKDDDKNVIKTSKYSLVVYDDVKSEWGGPYFTVIRTSNIVNQFNSFDVYEIDVGYQGQNMVIGFTIDDSQTYSILYDYSGKINQSEYIHRIDDNGNIEVIYSPNITSSSDLMKTTEADKTWWTNMTQLPIKATITIKGLLRPAILMSLVKLNVLFYGRKHISSGYYNITKQVDQIDQSGYKTTLTLLRTGGDI